MAAESVVRGVVAVIEREGRWLVIRRAEGIAAGGWWCFPGGAIERGESAAEALVREVREEVGLDVEPVGELWRWLRERDGLELAWWEARLRDLEQPVVATAAEVAEARWVTPVEFRGLAPVLESNLAFLEHWCQSAANEQAGHRSQ